jgi:hypothetical protein
MYQKMRFQVSASLSNRYSQPSIMIALLAVVLVFATSVPLVFAAVPTEGVVFEGESVPGIALGFTRAQVEAVYGEGSCRTSQTAGDFGYCTFRVDGEGQVDVIYRGLDGGDARNSPDDVVHYIDWYGLSGWQTTAGINTALALADRQAVVAAYPNAQVTYDKFGNIIRVQDYELGIRVEWFFEYLTGTTYTNMAISFPRTPPPPREKLARVSAIDLTTIKRQLAASVRVQDDLDLNVFGASVTATWTFPDAHTEIVTGTTDGFGTIRFTVEKARRGTYTFTIQDVILDGYTFDRDNSVLSASITNPK